MLNKLLVLTALAGFASAAGIPQCSLQHTSETNCENTEGCCYNPNGVNPNDESPGTCEICDPIGADVTSKIEKLVDAIGLCAGNERNVGCDYKTITCPNRDAGSGFYCNEAGEIVSINLFSAELDIEFDKFCPHITDFPRLNGLVLPFNNLIGSIPDCLADLNLQEFFVAFNQLEGRVPDFIKNWDSSNGGFMSHETIPADEKQPDITASTHCRVMFSGPKRDDLVEQGLVLSQFDDSEKVYDDNCFHSNAIFTGTSCDVLESGYAVKADWTRGKSTDCPGDPPAEEATVVCVDAPAPKFCNVGSQIVDFRAPRCNALNAEEQLTLIDDGACVAEFVKPENSKCYTAFVDYFCAFDCRPCSQDKQKPCNNFCQKISADCQDIWAAGVCPQLQELFTNGQECAAPGEECNSNGRSPDAPDAPKSKTTEQVDEDGAATIAVASAAVGAGIAANLL